MMSNMMMEETVKPLWNTLSHRGIIFAPKYNYTGISIIIRGNEIKLNKTAEEMAYAWAKKKNTPYVEDRVFQKNFVKDFSRALGNGFAKIKYEDIDFSVMYNRVDIEVNQKLALTKEEKKAIAAEKKIMREVLKKRYGTAIVDGKRVSLGNYMSEPPGIFIGRGDHPLRGRWKEGAMHEDVVLNLSPDAQIPKGDWAEIVHQPESAWIARWNDKLTGNIKYVWFSDESPIKQQKDVAKYDKAMNLAENMDKLVSTMIADMASNDDKLKTISTVSYLIYKTAMRVGDEKDEDEAETVGATTLKKEHVSFEQNNVKFDFLGKDSIRWKKTYLINGTDGLFLENLKRITDDTKPGCEIFPKIRSPDVNEYFSKTIDGISAKVFRTYRATSAVVKYLVEHQNLDTMPEKLHTAKMANLQAAIVCNHKRAVPKNFEQALAEKKRKAREASSKIPWEKTELLVQKVKQSKPKSRKAKSSRNKRIRALNKKIREQKHKHQDIVQKLKFAAKEASKTQDYSLGTSLRNYIDPRVYASWMKETNLEWEKMYSATLQKKFAWVKTDTTKWSDISNSYS